jgi:hypothetical protein
VTNIGSVAFQYCYKLVEVYNLSSLDIEKGSSNNGYIGYYAKDVYTSLDEKSKLSTDKDGYILYTDGETISLVRYTGNQTELVLPSNITEINTGAFYECSSLMSVTIPSSVTNICDYAFEGCSSLTSITIPNSVTSIERDSFYECSSLTSITIPESVTSIGYAAFWDCNSLTTIEFKGTMEQWNAITKGDRWNSETGDYVVICTDGKLDKDGNVVE